MGKVPYEKDVTVHWHQKGKALTACGQPWLSFWDEDPGDSWNRGSLPYGESTTTDTKVTCQTCLEARYMVKRTEMEEIASRITLFGVKKPKIKVKKIDHNTIAKRVAAVVVAELAKQGVHYAN